MNLLDSDYEKEYMRKKISKPLTKLEENIIGVISICGLLIGIFAIFLWGLALFGITII
jgi:hypothetical protein